LKTQCKIGRVNATLRFGDFFWFESDLVVGRIEFRLEEKNGEMSFKSLHSFLKVRLHWRRSAVAKTLATATVALLAHILAINEWKSAASFSLQVAALVPAMLCNFYLVKNHKNAKNSATNEAR